MAITQTVMRLAIRFSGQDLQAEINAANKLLVANNREQMFTTLFCGVIDVSTGTMTYCNCGHNPPIVVHRGEGALEALPSCGPPAGVRENASYVTRTIRLLPGDTLLLYTDGVTEAENAQSAQFGVKRLEQTLFEVRGHPARMVVEHVIRRISDFTKGAPQSDDITCMSIVRNDR